MFDEDQDVDDLDRLLVCPYESSHKVAAARMNHHLVKCRKNYFVNDTEKTICPFNAQHVIFPQEIETHKMLCSEKPDFVADDVKNGDEKAREDIEENVAVDQVEEKKAHTSYDSDLRTDKESDETGCINESKVGGLKDYNVNSTNGEAEEIVRVLENEDSSLNGENEPPPENGANEEKCDLKDMSVNAVSHMAGFEPQDDNIAIENQLSQSKANLSSENDVEDEPTMNGCAEEQFDYEKYAPTKEEKEEFLRLIKQHKDDQNGVDDKDESLNQNYTNQPWQQGYTYITQPYSQNQSYPGVYNSGTTFIAYPNGYHPVISNGQSPYPYSFQPGSGPVPQYIHQPVQPYEFNPGYTPRQHFRPSYRRRNYHHNNHSHNRHMHNGYHKHGHYNGHSHNHSHSYNGHSNGYNGNGHSNGYNGNGHSNGYNGNGHSNGYNGHSYSNGHGGRNHYNHYNNGYYSYESYSHTDTDSNSSASGHSDVGSTDHGVFNGNGHHSDKDRTPRQPKRTHHSSKGSVNLESIIHVHTDSDGESMLDLSPEPSETSESIQNKRKGEKDKVVRKLRKKLNEIQALENKKNSGVNMDCDQLKKLTRKRELEEELAALTID